MFWRDSPQAMKYKRYLKYRAITGYMAIGRKHYYKRFSLEGERKCPMIGWPTGNIKRIRIVYTFLLFFFLPVWSLSNNDHEVQCNMMFYHSKIKFLHIKIKKKNRLICWFLTTTVRFNPTFYIELKQMLNFFTMYYNFLVDKFQSKTMKTLKVGNFEVNFQNENGRFSLVCSQTNLIFPELVSSCGYQ